MTGNEERPSSVLVLKQPIFAKMCVCDVVFQFLECFLTDLLYALSFRFALFFCWGNLLRPFRAPIA